MATSGAMADFARMPAQKQATVFVVIGLLLAAMYWKLVYKSLGDDLEAAQQAHETNVSNNRKLADDIPKYEELRAHKAKLDELNKKNQAALPQEADIPYFFETLQRKVAESGAAIRKWTNKPGEPVETFIKIPVEVELSGTFMQIKRFFASLVQSDVRLPGAAPVEGGGDEPDRIVSIEDLQLSSPQVVNREIVMTAKFTAVTFRQADKPAPPAGAPKPAGSPSNAPPRPTSVAPTPAAKPAGAPANPPPLPPTGSSGAPASTPPLPSATTPAGARARVENSIDKGDTRNRNAAGVDEAKLKGGL